MKRRASIMVETIVFAAIAGAVIGGAFIVSSLAAKIIARAEAVHVKAVAVAETMSLIRTSAPAGAYEVYGTTITLAGDDGDLAQMEAAAADIPGTSAGTVIKWRLRRIHNGK